MSDTGDTGRGARRTMRNDRSRGEAQQRDVRRTALLLAGVALLFYLGFVGMSAFFR